jgi:hypothetical protein
MRYNEISDLLETFVQLVEDGRRYDCKTAGARTRKSHALPGVARFNT